MDGYLVTTVWWPNGWEPNTPLDVPKCLWQAQDQVANDPLPRQKAVATVRGLNQQNIDHPGTIWYVLATVKDEPASASDVPATGVRTDSGAAMIDTRRLEVVQLEGESGRGDCSHCPAHHFPCATES
jgi:hypothetical protein